MTGLSGLIETIYLAGPITGLSYAESMAWREEAIIELHNLGYVVFSPMRHKRHLKEAFSDGEALPHSHPAFRDPYQRDRQDIMRSDYVLVNLTDGVTSIGTAVEIGLASALDKYIIVVYPGDPSELHPFWKGPAHDIVWDLDAAYSALAEYRGIS